MKLKWVIITFCFLFSAAITRSYAQAETKVFQEIKLNENNTATVRYELTITNTSEVDLISEITFYTPFSSYKVVKLQGADSYTQQQQLIKLDLFRNPIDLKKSRLIVVELEVDSAIDKYGDFKRLTLPKFTGDVQISDYRVQIYYPHQWGDNLYTSRNVLQARDGVVSYNSNERIDFVWGETAVLNVYIEENIYFEHKATLLPIISDRPGQVVYLKDHTEVRELYSDTAGNLYVVPQDRGRIEFNSNVVIGPNNLSHPSPEELTDYDKASLDMSLEGQLSVSDRVERIVSELKRNYQLGERKPYKISLKELTGDELNLALLATNTMREEAIPSYVGVGWDLGLNSNGGYTYWVYWLENGQWHATDLAKILNGQSDNYKEVNPERVILFTIGSLGDKEFQKTDNFTKNPYTPVFTPINQIEVDDKKPDFSVLWDSQNSSTKHIQGKLNINNPTGSFLLVDDLKINGENYELSNVNGLKLAIMPYSFKILDIDYYDNSFSFEPNKTIDTDITFRSQGQVINASDQAELAHLKLIDPKLGLVFFASFITLFTFPLRLIALLARRINSYTIKIWKILPRHNPTTISTT